MNTNVLPNALPGAAAAGLLPDLPVVPGTIEQLIARGARTSGTTYDPAPTEESSTSAYEQYGQQPAATGEAAAAPAGPPGWNAEFEQELRDILKGQDLPEELITLFVANASQSGLPAESLEASMAHFRTPEGIAEIQAEHQAYLAGMPTYLDMAKALAPYAAGAVGVAGAGAFAYNQLRRSGDQVKPMFQANQSMTNRGQAGLQALLEREGTLKPSAASPISPKVQQLVDGATPSAALQQIATKHGVTPIAGETPASLANRIAQKTGTGFTAGAAGGFVQGKSMAPFNSGGGGAFRPYDLPTAAGTANGVPVKPMVGEGFAANRAAADRAGIGLLHPKQHLRMATEAFKHGPQMTAINIAKEAGKGKLAQFGAGASAGIAARGVPSVAGAAPTLANGVKGMGAATLKSMTGKIGVAGVVLGAGFEAKDVYKSINENGIDSKEAGNQIGESTGRIVGNVAGFAAGSMVASALTGAAVGTMIPVPVVGTVVGAVAGLAVGAATSYFGGEALAKVGSKMGDGLSAAGKFADKVDTKLDATANSVKDTVKQAVPIPDKAVDYAVDGVKELSRAVTNPVGLAKDAGGAMADAGKGIVNGIKGLFD